MKKTTDPPRLAIWLLTRRLSVEWRDFIVVDLKEEFGTRRGDSPVAAYAWFWCQTMRCLAAPPPVRPNPLRQGSSRSTVSMAENTALFAPMPSASVSTMVAVRPGVPLEARTAKRLFRQMVSNTGTQC